MGLFFLAVFAVFFGLGGWVGVSEWMGREWVEWMDGGSGDVFLARGGWVGGGVEVVVLIVGGEGGCLSRVGRFGIRNIYQKYGLGID